MIAEGNVLTLWTGKYEGGTGRRFVELVDGLAQMGNEVVLFIGQWLSP